MTNEPQQYNSLLAIEVKRKQLQKQIEESEKDIHDKWRTLFYESKKSTPATPTERIMKIATNSMGLIDGAILGWKLYRKFKRH